MLVIQQYASSPPRYTALLSGCNYPLPTQSGAMHRGPHLTQESLNPPDVIFDALPFCRLAALPFCWPRPAALPAASLGPPLRPYPHKVMIQAALIASNVADDEGRAVCDLAASLDPASPEMHVQHHRQ